MIICYNYRERRPKADFKGFLLARLKKITAFFYFSHKNLVKMLAKSTSSSYNKNRYYELVLKAGEIV